MLLQPVITIDADGTGARGHWHTWDMGGERNPDNPDDPADSYIGTGIDENEYVKVDGIWKIRTLHSYTRMAARDIPGWAESALPLSTIVPILPPDRALSVDYQPYPDTFIPALHYPNPVTGRR